MNLCISILVMGAALFGCSQSQPSPIAPRDVAIVGFLPDDGATQVTKIPTVLVVKTSVGTEYGYKELMAEVSLRVWPGLALVPTKLTYIPRTSQTAVSRIEIVADKPLGEGWYTFRIGALPQGYEWAPLGRQIRLPDGSFGSRFRIGSAPHLQRLMRCDAPGKKSTVDLEFSEPLLSKGNVAAVAMIATTDAKVVCSLLPGPGASTFAALTYGCDGLAEDAAIDISIGVGFESQNGRPLAPLNKPLRVTAADFGKPASSCRFYNVPFEP